MGTAKTDIVPQDMTTEIATVVTVKENTEATVVTETVATEEIDMEAEEGAGEKMTDVSTPVIDTVTARGTMMTIRDILPIMKMTGVETIEVHAKTITDSGMEAGAALVMIWALPEEVSDTDEVVVAAAAAVAVEAIEVEEQRVKTD